MQIYTNTPYYLPHHHEIVFHPHTQISKMKEKTN